MDTHLAIASKRDVRLYSGAPLSDQARDGILRAGGLAGSAKNLQNRRFIVLHDAQKEASALVTRPENVAGAALVIAIVAIGDGTFTGFDIGRAAQNMMLWAWNEGIASCPNAVADRAAIHRLLELGDDEGVAVLLSFGLPAKPLAPKRRSVTSWLEAADRAPLDAIAEYR